MNLTIKTTPFVYELTHIEAFTIDLFYQVSSPFSATKWLLNYSCMSAENAKGIIDEYWRNPGQTSFNIQKEEEIELEDIEVFTLENFHRLNSGPVVPIKWLRMHRNIVLKEAKDIWDAFKGHKESQPQSLGALLRAKMNAE